MRREIVRDSRILVIDDSPATTEALQRILNSAGFTHLKVADCRRVIPAFDEYRPDLVLLDLLMARTDGLSLLRQFRSRIAETDYLPILAVTDEFSRRSHETALALGAKDLINKPFDSVELLLRIHNLLETRWLHRELQRHLQNLEEIVRERTRELAEAQRETLECLAAAAEYRDDNTGGHPRRVGSLAGKIAAAMGLAPEDVLLIQDAAPLHDLGKVGIPDQILLKESQVTQDEYEIIKRHTGIGAQILSGGHSHVMLLAREIAQYHHERWDGGGYLGCREDQTPVSARIVALADSLDVMLHERPYRAGFSMDEAVTRIRQERGKQFDPHAVDAFLRLVRNGDLDEFGRSDGGSVLDLKSA